MSHKVTVQTEIKDRAIAIAALKASNITFRESGNDIHLTSGDCANATINLVSGKIVGDSDYNHDQGKLGILRQNYSEAKFRAEAFKQGILIQETTTNAEGDIVLQCQMA